MKRIFPGLALSTLTVVALSASQDALAQGGAWGTVKGRIIWGGKDIPEQKPIAAVAAAQDRAAGMKDGNVVIDEKWVVNKKNKGLQWTFVWLANEDVKNKAPLPIHPNLKALKVPSLVLDQPLCAFTPHALALREGQVLVAKNSAGIAHNLKWTGNPMVNPGNNVLIPAGGSLDIKGLTADRFPVKMECNIHPWMNGWIRIFDHPYYAVTGPDGAFELKDAPAGKYTLMVWHGSGGWRGGAAGKSGQHIQIKASATVDLGNLDYPPAAE